MSLYYKDIKIADHGYVLNLVSRKDRRLKVDSLLKSLHFSGYEFFDGKVIEDIELKKLGCTESELTILENFLSQDYQDIVLFEDDLKLMSGVTEKDLDNIFSNWQETKNNYDIIALGTKLLPRSEIIQNGETHGSFKEMLCTQSFYYKREIAQHVVERLRNYTDPNHYLYKCTIDMFLNDCTNDVYRFRHNPEHKTFNFGITLPMIFIQESDYSDLEQKEENYEYMMESAFKNSLNKNKKMENTKKEKGFVYYCNEKYIPIVEQSIRLIRKYSSLPIYVYLVDCSYDFKIKDVHTVLWSIDLDEFDETMYLGGEQNFYIKREDKRFYKLLIQRPLVVRHCLENYLETVAYLDTDTVPMPWVDNFFNHFDQSSEIPFFTECFYDYLTLNGKGGLPNSDFSNTLEHDTCVLLGVDQTVRRWYRQTGYFIAGQLCKDFLDEWYWLGNHPKILDNPERYAPFHEETIMNVLMWKKKLYQGLHIVYVNATSETVDKLFNEIKFNGENQTLGPWFAVPGELHHIYFLHGEKRLDVMSEMSQKIDNYTTKTKPRILFLAPHLSTGGMPGFLLKRILTLQEYRNEFDIYVVEYSNYSDEYVVQKSVIKHLIPNSNFFTLGENKMELIDILKRYKIDLVHIDDNVEVLGGYNKTSISLVNALYQNDRTWSIIETCHNVSFKPEVSKQLHPDAYAFCSPWHKEVSFSMMPSYSEVIEFPIDALSTPEEMKQGIQIALGLDTSKIHVVNVGLWTSGKNQKEGLEIAKLMEKSHPKFHFHFIGNQAPNFKDYWEPLMKNLPKNVTVWGERSDASLFIQASDIFMFNSTWECNPLVLREAITYGKKILARNLTEYLGMFNSYITPITDDLEETKKLLIELSEKDVCYLVPEGQSKKFANQNADLYQKVMSLPKTQNQKIETEAKIIQHFVNQPFLEIVGETESDFRIEFFDEEGVCHYRNILKGNHWIKLNRQYYTKWNTKVYQDNKLIYDKTLDLTNQRVLISFDSKSLGDSVAWIPYALEFQNKHNCHVVVSTFWNKLFQDVYPELEFVEPGTTVHNLIAMYKLGWFYNMDMEPVAPNLIPLQKAASNILGLEHKEVQPRISYKIGERPYKEKYVTIATNSTSGLKFWTREAWQELVDFLIVKGYTVVNVSKEKNPFNGVYALKDTSIENTMNVIHHSEFLVGLSSGLSWLAWGMGKHVVMISNFTQPDHEFVSNCTRITNLSVCNGCWNKPQFTFDKGDWNWCPEHKGTPRQFECHTSITAKMVINQIQSLF
jgi:autotransporter strand-loop-strand O-heptosyltransferase